MFRKSEKNQAGPKKLVKTGRVKGGVSCVVVAAGSSRRMGFDKLAAPFCGSTVIGMTLKALQASPDIDELVLVVREGAEQPVLEAASGCSKVKRIVHGGSTRTESAWNGVMACDPKAGVILIHDGARPLVSKEVIHNAVLGARDYGAAVPAIPVTDTIKVDDRGFVGSTPDRSTLFAAQTPQAFQTELIKSALQAAKAENLTLTDDCAAVERLGMRVKLVEGDPRNRKVTIPADLPVMEALWKEMDP